MLANFVNLEGHTVDTRWTHRTPPELTLFPGRHSAGEERRSRDHSIYLLPPSRFRSVQFLLPVVATVGSTLLSKITFTKCAGTCQTVVSVILTQRAPILSQHNLIILKLNLQILISLTLNWIYSVVKFHAQTSRLFS